MQGSTTALHTYTSDHEVEGLHQHDVIYIEEGSNIIEMQQPL
jgi:hypothetical protein